MKVLCCTWAVTESQELVGFCVKDWGTHCARAEWDFLKSVRVFACRKH